MHPGGRDTSIGCYELVFVCYICDLGLTGICVCISSSVVWLGNELICRSSSLTPLKVISHVELMSLRHVNSSVPPVQ
jgi:hypothetical protein